MRAAAYLRVSTSEQAEDDKFGLQVQANAITQYAARHSLSLSDTYSDAITGTRHRRTELDRLLDTAAAYDAVIISSIDRLGRRNRITYAVLDELLETGLQVHSTDMGVIDPEDESSMLTFGVKSLFAENDHRRTVAKLQHARVAKVAGNPLSGRVGVPVHPLNGYGWRNGVIDPVEAHWVRWMYARMEQVGSVVVARELGEQGARTRDGNIWFPENVRRLMMNPVYKGVYEYGRKSHGQGIVKARCEVEALVSPELWDSVARKLRTRQGRTGMESDQWAERFGLVGHLRCGECGRAMSSLHSPARAYGYYGCSYQRRASVVKLGQVCGHKTTYRAEQVHDVVLASLRSAVLDDAALLSVVRRVQPAPVDHGPALADLARRVDRLEAAYMAGAYTPQEYAGRRAELGQQRAVLLNAPAPVAPVPPDLTRVRARLTDALSQPLHQLADDVGLVVTLTPGEEIRVELDLPVAVPGR